MRYLQSFQHSKLVKFAANQDNDDIVTNAEKLTASYVKELLSQTTARTSYHT